jgi:putative glutamine amidotransferase
MGAPVIGLTGRRRPGADVAGTTAAMRALPFDVHVHAYSHAVAAHGGIPFQLPFAIDPALVVSRIDGLVLTGGADIDPARYGAARDPATVRTEPERDAFELALLDAARSRGIPVLGICRGCQLVNVAFGGSLHQHVPAHARFAGAPDAIAHVAHITPGTALHGLLGATSAVNSLHHQALDRIGHGLVVAATADGAVEAVEHRHEPVLAVQWHPELLALPQPVFAWLIERATAGAAAR